MRRIKRYFRGVWEWHLKHYATTYENMFGKYSYKV